MSTVPSVTYRHNVAGSTFILPNGKVCQFGGKTGTPGVYVTSDKSEQEFLDHLAKTPNVPVERLADATVEEVLASTETKTPDRAIAEAVADVNEIAAKNSDPAVVSAQASLQKLIAAGKPAA
jgi:hypothetical protein